MNSILIIISLLTVCIQTVQPRYIDTKPGLSFDRKCPQEQYIRPCVCEDTYIKKEVFDTFVFCKDIQNPELLKWAISGLRGHEIDSLYIENCQLPEDTNELFFDIKIKTLLLKKDGKMYEQFLSDSEFCSTDSSCAKGHYFI